MARTKDGWESREGASSCRGRPAPTSGPAELGETEEGLGPGLRLSLAERGTEAGRFPEPVPTAGAGHSQEQRGAQAVLAEQAAVAVVAAGGEVLEDAVAADPHGQLAGGAVQRLHHRLLLLPAAPFQEVPLHRQLRELGRVVVQRLLLPTHGGGRPRPEPEPEGAPPAPPPRRCLAAGRYGGGSRQLWRGTGPAPCPTPGGGTNGLPGQRGELSSAPPAAAIPPTSSTGEPSPLCPARGWRDGAREKRPPWKLARVAELSETPEGPTESRARNRATARSPVPGESVQKRGRYPFLPPRSFYLDKNVRKRTETAFSLPLEAECMRKKTAGRAPRSLPGASRSVSARWQTCPCAAGSTSPHTARLVSLISITAN